MGSIFTYSLMSSILLCIGYLAYKWIMAGERQHSLNRFALYAIYLLALMLPVVVGKLSNPFPHAGYISIGQLELVQSISTTTIGDTAIPESSPRHIAILTWLFVYIAGMAVSFLYTLIGTFRIVSIIRTGEKIDNDGFTLAITKREDIAPFSFMHYYVMSRADYLSAGEVISTHERRHLRLRHWIDLIIVQCVRIFQWYNPAAWLMGDEVKAVHEYQADEAVMYSGANLKDYQLLLVKKAVGTRFQSLANSLNHSKLKKRVTMMYKSESSKTRRIGALLLVPAMALGCSLIETPAVASVLDRASEATLTIAAPVANIGQATTAAPEAQVAEQSIESAPSIPENDGKVSQNPAIANNPAETTETATQADDEKVYTAPEQPAEYPGGMKALMNYLIENIRYPENAYKNSIQGRVIVKFVVDKDGTPKDFTILKGVDPELDAEAIRVLQGMKKWIPGKVNGEPVASYFNLPVTFKIREEVSDEGTAK